jgi:hypothetical protein
MVKQFKTVEEGADVIRNALNVQEMSGINTVISDFTSLNTAVQDVAMSIADKIGQIGTTKPSMAGIYQAQQELDNLRKLSAEVAAATGQDLSAAITQAETNLNNFTNAAVNAQLAVSNFNAIVFSLKQF